jgi:hypothetical protein
MRLSLLPLLSTTPVLGRASVPAGRCVAFVDCAASAVVTRVGVDDGTAVEPPPPAPVVGVAVLAPPPEVGVEVGTLVGVDVPGTAVDVGVSGVGVSAGGVFVGGVVGVSVGAVTPSQWKLTLFDVFIVLSYRSVFASGGTFATLKPKDTGLVVPAGKSTDAPGTATKSEAPGM